MTEKAWWEPWAEELASAQKHGKIARRLSDDHPQTTVHDAYEIQDWLRQRALTAGEGQSGWKMGLTSEAKRQAVQVHEPIFGWLGSSMELTEGLLPWTGMIHPRVEPELAVILSKPLQGQGLKPRDVWRCVEAVVPAMEVIDSRYEGFQFSLVDVVADNASAVFYSLGLDEFSPFDQEWGNVGVSVYKNGELQQTGSGAAVLGHPINAVIRLADMLAQYGMGISAGMVILTGGITDAVAVQPGDHITVHYEGMGTLGLHVENA